MKQPTINITDTNSKDWGEKKIVLLKWFDGKINYIEIDWYNTDRDCAPFYLESDGTFRNIHKNLIGKTINF